MGAQETRLTSKIEKWWKKQGTFVVKFHGNEFSMQGAPDLFMCYKGRFIGMEVKVNGNKPTPIQLERIRQIKDWYEGHAVWVNEDNWEEISIKIKEEIDGCDSKTINYQKWIKKNRERERRARKFGNAM